MCHSNNARPKLSFLQCFTEIDVKDIIVFAVFEQFFNIIFQIILLYRLVVK